MTLAAVEAHLHDLGEDKQPPLFVCEIRLSAQIAASSKKRDDANAASQAARRGNSTVPWFCSEAWAVHATTRSQIPRLAHASETHMTRTHSLNVSSGRVMRAGGLGIAHVEEEDVQCI